ncbi:MAG: cell division protein FtsQ/DivIB [Gammaproteobacteria bacterium]|nr:cell division protein FtsQ/DivIB [Gammaproteobacteria bacterium]
MKKKYRYIIAILCVITAIAWIFFSNIDQRKSHFPIRQVIIEGEYWNIPQSDLETIIAPYASRGYFFANLFTLQHELQVKEPWVQSASVSRHWPDKIVVALKQKIAVAILNNQALLTPAGDVFTPAINSFPPDLPILFGPKQKAEDILKKYVAFTSIASSVNLTVLQVKLSAENNWSVELSNKIVVMLGEEDILAKFARFTKVYEQVFVPQHREPSYVDMRYSHGMAVNWKS